MTCAACQARVEKAVSKVPGVTECAVSLLTNSMGVEGNYDPADIIAAVENAGYGAKPMMAESTSASGAAARLAAEEEALKDKETPLLKKRLIASLGFLCVLMYFSMGHMMWGWPLPAWFDGNHVAMGLVQLLLAAIVMVINQRFFISGFKSLFHGSPNMDSLVALGSMASFVYSTFALFLMSDAVVKGDSMAAMGYMHEFYFESAAMILTLITVGKMLEARSKGRTTDALKGLMKLAPKTAVVLRNGVEKEIPIETIRMLAYGSITPSHAGMFAAFVKQLDNKYLLEDIIKGDARWPEKPEDRDVLYFIAQSFRARLLHDLPQKKAEIDKKNQYFAHRAKSLLKELAQLNYELAQMVVSADDGKVLPEWFMIEIVRDLPRLVAQEKKKDGKTA